VADDAAEAVVAVGDEVGLDDEWLTDDALDRVTPAVDGRLDVADDHSTAAVEGQIDRRHRGVRGEAEGSDPRLPYPSRPAARRSVNAA
jgi:hypothetical protein